MPNRGSPPIWPCASTPRASSGATAHWCCTVAAELPVEKCVIGSGACALADAVQLTRAIVQAGAAGALILPPFYYKSPGEDGLYAFFSEVIERTLAVLPGGPIRAFESLYETDREARRVAEGAVPVV